MNKYQEALDELSFPLYDSSCGGCKCGTSDCQDCEKAQAVFTLQELVEKATPKKPEIKELIRKDNYRDGTNIPRFDWWCPNCHLEHISGNDINYCPTCGQALDWSGEDE